VDPIPDADVRFPVTFNNANYEVYVRKRPHLDKFFALIAGKFEVTVFTASQQVYAERLLNLLDPEGKHIHHRLYRDSCLNVDGNFLKDLNVLGRDLTKTVLVDNSPHAFGYQLENGVPIESWFEDKSDKELLKVRRSPAPAPTLNAPTLTQPRTPHNTQRAARPFCARVAGKGRRALCCARHLPPPRPGDCVPAPARLLRARKGRGRGGGVRVGGGGYWVERASRRLLKRAGVALFVLCALNSKK
jgi:Dullard-like phosphatase family protein